MKHDHNAFENQIFNHYRINKKKIEQAIKFLQEHGCATTLLTIRMNN